MSNKAILTLCLAVCLVFMVVCEEDNNPSEPENGVKADPSFAQDIQPIFTAKCASAGCHNVISASANLVLVEGEAYTNLVDVDSKQESSLKRVKASDSENSYLVIKIEGTQTNGTQRMPIGGSPLSENEIQLIISWIDEGAKNN